MFSCLKLSALEILAESLVATMDEKERELSKAEAARQEYSDDIEQIQAWLQNAEARIQERSVPPQQLQNQLQSVNGEVSAITNSLERLNKNGQTLADKSPNAAERDLVQSTCNNLNDQLAHVRHLLEQRKIAVSRVAPKDLVRHHDPSGSNLAQAGDAKDAWEKFLSLYEAVISWSGEKMDFVAEPLQFRTLAAAKQKLQDYSAVVKTVKYATKNLQEMSRELGKINQVASSGNLGEKLDDADKRKAETEAHLTEKVLFSAAVPKDQLLNEFFGHDILFLERHAYRDG